MIAIPDFEAGAMENAGAITFRETALLLDDEHASVERASAVWPASSRTRSRTSGSATSSR